MHRWQKYDKKSLILKWMSFNDHFKVLTPVITHMLDFKSNRPTWRRTVGQIHQKCKETSNLIVVDIVYFSFVLFYLLKLILYNSKPQNQMCDWNQKCLFCFTKILNQAFYMTRTFDSGIFLRYWLLWPTVRRKKKPQQSRLRFVKV